MFDKVEDFRFFFESARSCCKISIDIGRRLLLACWKLEGFVTLI
jgi:hypothetical protein